MTDYERTSEEQERKRGKGSRKEGEREGGGRFRVGWIAVVAILRTFMASQFFSFDYSTRANASRSSRRLHLTAGRNLKI